MQPTGNLVLDACSSGGLLLSENHLVPVSLSAGDTLARAGHPIADVYFLKSGIAALFAGSDESTKAAVGLFGRDGFSGADLVLGATASSLTTRVEVAGAGYRLSRDTLLQLVANNAAVRDRLNAFCLAHAAQIAETALFNVKRNIESRLARWLLMCHDRVEGYDIQLSHDALATMLGVRRASVTEALHLLEGDQAVHSTRLRVTVRDRARLEAIAAGQRRARNAARPSGDMDGVRTQLP